MRFIIGVIVLFAALPAAALDPHWSFRVLTSPHFEIIYREDQKELAKRYLIAAEQAHELLFPIFKEAPSHTTILLKDDTDASNGLANFLPYPHITVYPVLPSTLDSVDEYGDWAFEMILHEYTHILNMYPAHSFYVPLKYVFGTVVRPNAVLPRWYLEGLATNLESWLSDHGRLRSTETQASARALILGQRLKLEDVARINETDLKTWPYGGRPYLFGAWWWEEVHRQKGTGVIETWNQNYSRRLPFFLNGPVIEQLQKSPNEFLNLTADTLDAQGRKQIEQINKAGAHTSTPVAEAKGEQTVFAISPDGNKLIYWLNNPGAGNEVRLKERKTPNQPWSEIESKKLFKTVGSLRVHWIDNERFVYDQMDIKYPWATYRDIYIRNVNTGERTRLTEQKRAQEPAPSPSGQQIAFIQNDGGRNRLNLLNVADGSIRTLVNGNYTQRLSWPEFVGENEIVFAVRQRNGSEKLHVYNLESKQTQVWNEKLQSAQNARFITEGLLVTDAGTKARNIYLVKKTGEAEAVSNTLTDIQYSDYDPQRKELVFSELTGEGRRLKSAPLTSHHPPVLETADLPPPPKPTITKVAVEEESYQPIKYLVPRYWIPFVYQVEDGLLFQGLTANQDPAMRNQYSLMASYDTVSKEPSYGFSYLNSSLPTDIGVSYAKAVSYLGASGLTVDSQGAALNFSQFWPFNSRFSKWAVGGQWTQTEQSTVTYKRAGPELSWQYSRLDNPLNENWGFHAEFAHQEYLKQSDYLDYGRTYGHLAAIYNINKGHRIFWQGRGAVAPKQPFGTIIELGDRNVGGNYLINLANSDFLLRGYPSGTFVGRKIANGNLEYIFPLTDLDKGFGTFPLFLRNLEVALFADAMAVDGAGYDSQRLRYTRSHLSEFYMGYGTELRLSTTTFYHLPFSFTLGLYYGANDRFGGGFSPFLGFGFGGLSGLENKKD